ncbi:hypothetical protein QTI66_00385 [Variovorax sp. J22R133]|uniref:hypothetical protein n=1 Tax=Variovorax brevis TaxID=3053503 RepID=UPI00257842EF|nr:hypothetical protein [Variovorax sp. J22R133]MDM0110581.1 hypothetical protein [Variovorax sp. J22R133]
MTLAILTALLAFTATAIATLSVKTVDWERRRLTLVGWVAIAVAFTAFLLASYQAFANSKKENAVAKLAGTQISNAVATLTLPFTAVINVVNEKPALPATAADLAQWKDAGRRQKIVNVRKFWEEGRRVLPGPPQGDWIALFCTFTGRGQEELKSRIAPFYGVLSEQLIAKANDVINDPAAADLRSMTPCGRLQDIYALDRLLSQPSTLAYVEKLIILQNELALLQAR